MGKGLIGGLSDLLGLDAILDPGAGDRRRAMDMQDAAARDWDHLRSNAPSAGQIYTGVRAPALHSLQGDQGYQAGAEAQQLALQQMQGIAGAGGYTGLERSQIQQAQQQAAQYERSQRLAALQQMQARGMAGGGGELAARLQAQQGGANRAANDATNIATAAQQRALQAMQSSGQQGAQMADQGMQRAQAVDAFNRANSQARGTANQQTYQNQMDALAGATGQYNANANSMYDQATQRAQQAQSLVTSVIGAVA